MLQEPKSEYAFIFENNKTIKFMSYELSNILLQKSKTI